MTEWPPPIKKGWPKSWAKWLNQLLAAAQQCKPLRSDNCEVNESESGTEIRPLITPGGSSSSATILPFGAAAMPTPGGGPAAGWISICLFSMLCGDPNDPTKKITITGLGDDGAFQVAKGDFVWLDANCTAFFATPGSPITAKIDHGAKWGSAGKSIFPKLVEYDTDDGTPRGSSGTAPDNVKQTHAYMPIGRADDPDSEDFQPQMKLFGIPIGKNLSYLPLVNTHAVATTSCASGTSGLTIQSGWWAPIPSPH